ncbi:MAG: hypothetical protein F6J87_02025 [Spirulina sp. SIO3F2]|nr:hypothetical protein [Spirulina sp. SIO3F2]
MTELQRNLDRIVSWIESNDPRDDIYFEPGISRSESQRIFKDLPFSIADEILELYAWRNGMSHSSYAFLGMDFYSASKMLYMRSQLLEEPTHELDDLCPIFALGDYVYVFTLGATFQKDTAPIFFFDLEDKSLVLAYESLTKMISTLTQCCDRNVFSLTQNKDGAWIEFDKERFEEIRTINNPNIPQVSLSSMMIFWIVKINDSERYNRWFHKISNLLSGLR